MTHGSKYGEGSLEPPARIAQQLVRAFAGVLLSGLLDRYPFFVPAGDPVRKSSVSRHAWLYLPIQFHSLVPAGQGL